LEGFSGLHEAGSTERGPPSPKRSWLGRGTAPGIPPSSAALAYSLKVGLNVTPPNRSIGVCSANAYKAQDLPFPYQCGTKCTLPYPSWGVPPLGVHGCLSPLGHTPSWGA
ncbi:unnamed protein product, partial [Musa textilis]